ncbi:Nucleoside-diphosphate-sugar epimerase [Catalinimonas alkaloidigena]|uniref:Nucleoside-diphosphate-sugar epimerase n=1 Tax=Catalinimonas alkaloidigena TaxID=1075417 RepID=A0A1G9DG60_9BACT|nr:NAD(P)-dependent oxidoreductase [Catalinimonas alkaloidigena]SDK62832.1 Nucleoside-diphosphate-sugar epimerase [Catalinimonas alkaloidigena]
MKILITGSAGHLGEALVRTLQRQGHEVVGTDVLPSATTHRVGSITDRDHVRRCMQGVEAVVHTATLHKPHVATHSRQAFVDTNITGTLHLLEEAAEAKVRAFVFTSTTSVFGDAMAPNAEAPTPWITEEVVPIPKNIYGVTKVAAEDLCQLFHRNQHLPCLILRTSRFFAEEDDHRDLREAYADANIKTNEFLYRRVDLEDVVSAHLLAIEKVPALGFGRYIISATTPFTPDDLPALRTDAPTVVRRRVPAYEAVYARLGWRMFPHLDRVYVNTKARMELGWQPHHDFDTVLKRLENGQGPLSSLANQIGAKGYHSTKFSDGPYPVC